MTPSSNGGDDPGQIHACPTDGAGIGAQAPADAAPPVQFVRGTLLPILAIFIITRAAVLLVLKAAAAYLSQRPDTLAASGWLCHWDCIWYLSIADIGYTQTEITQGSFAQTNFCFLPLLPLATRFLGYLLHGNILYAGLLFTNACFLAALVYIFRYARLLGVDRRGALLAVALICVLPQSIAFSALLSESPYLLLLAMAIYHARRGDYLIAGVAAALLSATRANGVLFVVFAFALAIRCGGVRGLFAPWRAPERYLPIVLAPVGLFAFWTYCYVATGDAFAQVSAAEHGWSWHFYPVWENVATMLYIGGQPRYAALAGLATLGCALLLIREKLYEEFLFCFATIVLILSGSGVVSVFRYWIVLFPIWVIVAKAFDRRPLLALFVFIIAGALNIAFLCALALRSPLSL